LNRFALILRSVIIIFIWPLPFLVGFAIEHGGDWTAWVAYIAVVVLVSAAVTRGRAPAQGVTCVALQKAAEGQYDIGECHKN
jgi:hypothetical protein